MTESEISGSLELGTPAWSPVHARLIIGTKKRWAERGGEVLDAVLAAIEVEALEIRLQASPELDSLLARAVNAAAASGLDVKRRLLGKIVREAVLDDAAIDQAGLITDVLSQLEAVHVRCLESIHRAELAAREAGEQPATARRAEKPLTGRVTAVVDQIPGNVLARLVGLHLVDGRVMWDGSSLASGLTTFGEDLLEALRTA